MSAVAQFWLMSNPSANRPPPASTAPPAANASLHHGRDRSIHPRRAVATAPPLGPGAPISIASSSDMVPPNVRPGEGARRYGAAINSRWIPSVRSADGYEVDDEDQRFVGLDVGRRRCRPVREVARDH